MLDNAQIQKIKEQLAADSLKPEERLSLLKELNEELKGLREDMATLRGATNTVVV